MANPIENLIIQLTLDNKKLTQSVKSAEGTINRFASNVKFALEAAVSVLATGVIANFAKNLATNFADAGTKVYFLSKQLNESVTTIGTWQQAVKRMGGTAEGATNSIGNMFNQIQSARFTGGNQTTGLLNYLGVNPLKTSGEIKKTTDIMLELADKFKGMDTGKQQYFGAQLGLDPATIQLLAQGRKALEDQLRSEQKLGVINERQAQRAVMLKNKLQDLSQTWEMLGVNLGDKLMPVAMKFSSWAQDYLNRHSDQIVAGFGKLADFIEKLATQYIPYLIKQFDSFSASTGITIDDLGKLLVAFVALKAGVTVFQTLAGAVALLTSPLGKISALLLEIYKGYQLVTAISENWNNPVGLKKSYKEIFGDKAGGVIHSIGEKIGGGLYDLLHPDELSKAQMAQESGGKNVIGYKYQTKNGKLVRDAQGKAQYALDAQGNKIPEAYGVYQIRPETASRTLGRPVSGQELMDPKFNTMVRDKIMQEAMQKAGGDPKGALAYYNGGMGGLKEYQRTGATRNKYAEQIMSKIPQQTEIPPAQPEAPTVMNSSMANNATTNKNTSVSIQNLNLPNVNNPQDFFQEMQKKSEMGWAFSQPRLA